MSGQHSVLWQRRDQPSFDHCTLTVAGDIRFKGTIVALLEEAPATVRYQIVCSPDWRTRAVDITVERAGTVARLGLRVDDEHRWWRAGAELTEFRGVADIDLEISPVTNTLPIQRSELATGASLDVTAAWVRFPALTLEPLAQRYTRSGRLRYDYESNQGEFRAELEVDETGLIVRYGDLWERIAPAH